MTAPCMCDNGGRTVTIWLPHMQSSDFLRDSIRRGERTDECWAELAHRNGRVRAGMLALGRVLARVG